MGVGHCCQSAGAQLEVWRGQVGCSSPGKYWEVWTQQRLAAFWGRGRATLMALWGLLQPLTIAEVQNLLGPNLVGLKAEQERSPVRDWIVRQQQDDLDSLGLGLHGGLPNGYLVMDLRLRGGLGCSAGWGWGRAMQGA